MTTSVSGFHRRVSSLFWTACDLDDARNYALALSMFYLGYTEMSVRMAVAMAWEDPIRMSYINTAVSLGLDVERDTVSQK